MLAVYHSGEVWSSEDGRLPDHEIRIEMEQDRPDVYAPGTIEAKWQAAWDEQGTNSFTQDSFRNAEEPFYNLMMFPYPSAEGLHVGNIYAFTGADVHGRYQRLTGKNVFEPIGFDAFGIHSENFALKMGVNPMDLTPKNVANFTRQLRRIGGMFDWDHTVNTSDPEYYRWTQWIFLQLFKAGLAERKEAPVNWCPSCMTVLANEQVIVGPLRAVRHAGGAAADRPVVLPDHGLHPTPAGQPEDHRLVRDHPEGPGKLDRAKRRGHPAVPGDPRGTGTDRKWAAGPDTTPAGPTMAR